MAFDLKDTNLSGLPVIENPDSSYVPRPENFITKYDYAMKFAPQLIQGLHFSNGKGSITGVLDAVSGGRNRTYASDMIQWAEQGRLHLHLEGVTIASDVFTCPKPHQLRPNDIVAISDGEKEWQAHVVEIISTTKFKALNKSSVAFPTDPVTIIADFFSSDKKGGDGMDRGKNWDPKNRQNFTQIIPDNYTISNSDAKHITWVAGPNDEAYWMHTEIERYNTMFDNKVEMAILFNERGDDNSAAALAGLPRGQHGVIPFVEQYGNIANDLITTDEHLSDLAFRAKQQGVCREFMYFARHAQMRAISQMAKGLNAAHVNGGYYGAFNNSKDMALALDFTSIYIDGVDFHFKPWALLDDPTLLGATNFDTSSLSFFGVPTGKVDITNNGNVESVPYLEVLYRGMDRKRKMKMFGLFGTEVKGDRSFIDLLTECTNRVVGANNFVVGRTSNFYV